MDFPYFMCFKICIFSLFLDGALAWFYLRFAQSVGAKVIVYSAFYLCLNFSFFLVFFYYYYYYYYYYYFFLLTVKFRKPWTLEILIKCYCVSSKTPITRENNLEAVKKISLWFHLTSDWLLHNGNCQNRIKVFSAVLDSHSNSVLS